MALTKTSIFSLTEAGAELAERLLTLLPAAQHLHRPEPFIDTAQQAFANRHDCIFICATGIVMRALAPLIQDKYQDPAVIVLDQNGKFVIPLLSSHAGGGSQLGAQIAQHLQAELVQTSATDYAHPVYCIGVGADNGCPPAMLQSLYQHAMTALPQPVDIALVASINLKQQAPAMLSLAQKLSVPFSCFEASQLRQVEHLLSQKSAIVFRAVGCYGVAEAAALVGASSITGNPSELILPKQKNARSTISVARSYR